MQNNQTGNYFIGLDVGTAWVRCIVGMLEAAESAKPTIVGHGVAANKGMRKGVVAHLDDVAAAISQALTEAERVSGIPIKSATVNVNGGHIQGMNSKGVVAISAASREITEDDRARVEEAATIVQMPANREILQVFAREYRIDGQESVKDPVGLQGVRLEVDTHIVTAASPFVRMLSSALEKADVTPRHRVVGGLAAAEAVLERQQKEAGVVVIDIGAGTTNIIVLEEGEVQHVAVLPVGGLHITNDLAIGLRTDLDVAEVVKLKHTRLDKRQENTVKMTYKGQEHSFAGTDVSMIVEARLSELFEYVDKELKRIQRSRKLPGGAVLVGGTAQLPGIAMLASNTLQLPSRVGSIHTVDGVFEGSSGPEFATATGLMLLDMLLGGGPAAAPQSSLGGMFKGLTKKLRKHS